MELVTEVIFLVLSSVNNDLSIYVFARDVDCEIRYVGTTVFLQMFMWWTDCGQRIKDLLVDKFSI